MIKLLRADLSRLFRSKTFWLCAAAIFVLSVVMAFDYANYVREAIENGYYQAGFGEERAFILAPVLGGFAALFSGTFLGTDYSCGTIRNKIIIGHSRRNIYLANLFTCFAGGAATIVLWFIGIIFGMTYSGIFDMGFWDILVKFLTALGFTAVFCAVYVLIGMLISNRTVTVALSLVIWIGLTIAGYCILGEFENINPDDFVPGENDSFMIADSAKGKFILCGILSKVLPTCQMLFMQSENSIEDVLNNIGLSVGFYLPDIVVSALVTAAITALGVCIFRKKDIR